MKTIIFITLLLQTCALLGTPENQLAFDIGTGKIKMQVVQIDDKKIKTLYQQSEKILVSEKSLLDHKNMISKEGKERMITILKSLKSASEQYAPTKCTAIATELFRVAINGQEVATEISRLLDMEIKIISPEEEGILGFLTIIEESNLDPKDVVVIDIGSGSFQITCKKEDRFLVYSAPFGRFPANDLVKKNDLSDLENKLNTINPDIVNKIKNCKGLVIGIGAHPKQILKIKNSYVLNDLTSALQTNFDLSLDHSDLILVKKIMEILEIKQINYLGTQAGNTSGIFIRQIKELDINKENTFLIF